MADDRMVLFETMRKAIADGDADFLRDGVKALAQAVMEAEVTELTGLPHGERDPERRLTHRNGYRERRWDTRVGTVPLSIPRVRDGSYFPSLLEPRRRAERAVTRWTERSACPRNAIPIGSGDPEVDGRIATEVVLIGDESRATHDAVGDFTTLQWRNGDIVGEIRASGGLDFADVEEFALALDTLLPGD